MFINGGVVGSEQTRTHGDVRMTTVYQRPSTEKNPSISPHTQEDLPILLSRRVLDFYMWKVGTFGGIRTTKG